LRPPAEMSNEGRSESTSSPASLFGMFLVLVVEVLPYWKINIRRDYYINEAQILVLVHLSINYCMTISSTLSGKEIRLVPVSTITLLLTYFKISTEPRVTESIELRR
jgi:uncharacterized membrane protein